MLSVLLSLLSTWATSFTVPPLAGPSQALDVLEMLLGLTMVVKEEKLIELRLDTIRRRRQSWCEDGARSLQCT